MIGELSPGLILILGAVVVPLLNGWLRAAWMLALPVIAFGHLLALPYGDLGQITLAGLQLTTLKIDRLSSIFGYIFLIATLLGVLYSLYHDDWMQHTAGLVYAGSAVGAVFAGDLVTLFLYWEGTAVASVFLIWATRTERAFATGMRYLIIQIGSGVLLLAGILMHAHDTGSIAFTHMGLVSTATWLMFIAIGIKCAFPLLHNWLQDSYPEATPGGTVILSAFTTKLAIYALARGFAGTDILVPIGATMAAFPVFHALIENDLRRVLAYSLNSQLGFMVVGVGIGTELALNGTAAHAVCSIIYKALLFMAMGAVLLRAGTCKVSELGGLHKSMPWTTGFCLVGAASISAFPLFSGFVSKSLILSAAMKGGYFWTWLILLFAAVAAVLHSAIKVPFAAFFASDRFGQRPSGRPDEAPWPMLAAMALSAALCIGIGVFPGLFYELLPFKVSYAAYTLEHVVTQLQVLVFAGLAFVVAFKMGRYPLEQAATNLGTDWLYRKAGYSLVVGLGALGGMIWKGIAGLSVGFAEHVAHLAKSHHGPEGIFGRTWPTGTMAFWTTVLLGAYLLASYI